MNDGFDLKISEEQWQALQRLHGQKVKVAWERDADGSWTYQEVERLERTEARRPLALRCERQGLFGVRLLRTISELRDLRYVELGDFWDHGRRYSGLHVLAALPGLETLNLGTAYSGSTSGVRDKNLAEVARVPRLQHLALHRSRGITDAGLEHLAPLRELRSLNLHKCRGLTGRRLRGLPALEELIMSQCAVEDRGIRRISHLMSLDRLDLSHCDMGGDSLRHLAALPCLEVLLLRFCGGIEDRHLEHLEALPRLRSLDLSGVALSDSALPILGRMDRLTQLYVSADVGTGCINERISDAGVEALAGLRNLEHLELGVGTRVTDASLEHLAGLERLEVLNLDYTAVTAEGVARLQQALPQTQIRWGATIDEVAEALDRYFD